MQFCPGDPNGEIPDVRMPVVGTVDVLRAAPRKGSVPPLRQARNGVGGVSLTTGMSSATAASTADQFFGTPHPGSMEAGLVAEPPSGPKLSARLPPRWTVPLPCLRNRSGFTTLSLEQGTVAKFRDWVEGDRGFIEARFRADAKGLEEARRAEAAARDQGFTVINVEQTGGGINTARSIGASLVGLSLLPVTGFGFFGLSRGPGEIVVTFEKTGPSLAELAQQRQVKQDADRVVGRVIAEHPELQSRAKRGPHGQAQVASTQPTQYGATVLVRVWNTDPYTWESYEVEAVVYRPGDGLSLGTFRKIIESPLASGRSAASGMSVSGVPFGDAGVLVAVTRVRVDGAWR